MSTELLPTGPIDASETVPTSNNPGNTHAGANYFFGFLITFVVLLLVFIGCGFGSRRRMERRRAMFLSNAGPWAGLGPGIAQEPALWEPKLAKGGGTWSAIMPLSITVLQPKDVEEKTAPSTTISASRSLSTFAFSSWISGSRSASNRKIDGASAVSALPTEPVELQLAVMIALPSNKTPTSVGSVVGPNECQFGVIHIPWEGGQTEPFHISR